MSDPAEEATAPPSPASDGDAKPARGPTPAKLDSRQRDELLDLVSEGKGIDQALRQMDGGGGKPVPYRAYLNTIHADPDFRAEVASARRSAGQRLEETGFLTAQAGDADFLLKLLERRDRVHFLNVARRDRRRERAEDREEKRIDRALRLHLAEMQAAAREKERAEKAGGGDAGPEELDFSKLGPDDLAQFRDLIAKLRPAGAEGPGG